MKIETRWFHVIQQVFLFLEKKIIPPLRGQSPLTKSDFLSKRFSITLITIFVGFLTGNVFGTFLTKLREFIYWDIFIVFLILAFCEFTSFLMYTKQEIRFGEGDFDLSRGEGARGRGGGGVSPPSTPQHPLAPPKPLVTKQLNGFWSYINFKYKHIYFQKFIKLLNSFKIGLLFGFFVDAFKVGS